MDDLQARRQALTRFVPVNERRAGIDRSRAKEFAPQGREQSFRAVGKEEFRAAATNQKSKRRFSRMAEGFDQQPRTERP